MNAGLEPEFFCFFEGVSGGVWLYFWCRMLYCIAIYCLWVLVGNLGSLFPMNGVVFVCMFV